MTTELSIEQRLIDLERRVISLEKIVTVTDSTMPKLKKISAKEFLMTKTPKTETQKTVALAYFLEHEQGMVSFNVADLENVFRLAKENSPKNLNDAVNKNIARGLMMEAAEKKENKKAWELTATGEKYVENELNK